MFAPFFAFMSLVLLLPLYFVAIWSFDELVRSEYTFHRQDWEREGKPYGRMWRPPEQQRGAKSRPLSDPLVWRWSNQNWSSLEASQRAALAWLFRTPTWMRRDRRTLRLIKWYRFTAFIFAAVAAAYPITTFCVIIEALVTTFS